MNNFDGNLVSKHEWLVINVGAKIYADLKECAEELGIKRLHHEPNLCLPDESTILQRLYPVVHIEVDEVSNRSKEVLMMWWTRQSMWANRGHDVSMIVYIPEDAKEARTMFVGSFKPLSFVQTLIF